MSDPGAILSSSTSEAFPIIMQRIAALPALLDSTMLTTFRACPRKFFHEFCLNLGPKVGISIDLHAGKCFAVGLETVYNEVFIHKSPVQDALTKAALAFTVAWGQVPDPDQNTSRPNPKTHDRMWDAVEYYFEQYPPLADHVQPFIHENRPTFEFTFALPLDESAGVGEWPVHPVSGDPFLFGGRFDALGRMGSKVVVRDEKTSRNVPGPYWAEQWDLRSQFLGYVWACNTLGIPVDTVIVRNITIQKTQFSTLEIPKLFPKERVQRWLLQTRRDIKRMVDNWNEQYFDYNFGESCTSYGICAFHQLCISEHPDRWYGLFGERNWSPITTPPA